MSNTKKIVKISEVALIDLIDNIVTETVAVKKQEWLNEQAKTDKTALLEAKLQKLEKAIAVLSENKK